MRTLGVWLDLSKDREGAMFKYIGCSVSDDGCSNEEYKIMTSRLRKYGFWRIPDWFVNSIMKEVWEHARTTLSHDGASNHIRCVSNIILLCPIFAFYKIFFGIGMENVD